MIQGLDWFLRREQRIFEFCDHPECLFRVQVVRTTRPLRILKGEIAPGAKVLELHLWNEHIPHTAGNGAGLSWATTLCRVGRSSLHTLADRFESDPRLAGVEAVGGEARLFFQGKGLAAERIFRRLGFAITQHRSPLGTFGEFWENVHSWMIMWAFNPATSRHRSLLRMGRTDFWMSSEAFLQRFAVAPTPEEVEPVAIVERS